jgi:hypothetical protein
MIDKYEGPRFGFAVKNYYSEFLAAEQVHRYESKYFPGIEDEDAIKPAPIRVDFAPPKRSKHKRHIHHISTKVRRHKPIKQKT